jgi:outer membrane protein assembly factor BamB
VYAINATTGTQIWKYQTYIGSNWQSEPVISSGRVYVDCEVAGNSQQQGICALNASTGKREWKFFVDCNCLPQAGMETSPAISGSTIVFGYHNGGVSNYVLTALNATKGTVLWQTAPANGQGFSNAPPAIYQGNVYVGEGGDGLCALLLTNGTPEWCAQTGDSTNMPAASGGVVYVNTFGHGIFAFNSSTGAQIWQYLPTSNAYNGYDDPPAVAGGTVYVAGGGGGGLLYALKAKTGTLLYTTAAAGAAAATDSSPSIANGVVYVNCFDALCAFKATDGSLLFEGPNNDNGADSSAAIVNGVVYTGCGSNNVCAFGLPSSSSRRL